MQILISFQYLYWDMDGYYLLLLLIGSSNIFTFFHPATIGSISIIFFFCYLVEIMFMQIFDIDGSAQFLHKWDFLLSQFQNILRDFTLKIK